MKRKLVDVQGLPRLIVERISIHRMHHHKDRGCSPLIVFELNTALTRMEVLLEALSKIDFYDMSLVHDQILFDTEDGDNIITIFTSFQRQFIGRNPTTVLLFDAIIDLCTTLHIRDEEWWVEYSRFN